MFLICEALRHKVIVHSLLPVYLLCSLQFICNDCVALESTGKCCNLDIVFRRGKPPWRTVLNLLW